MKKFPSMNKLEFMMTVAQLGGWQAVEVRGYDYNNKLYVRRFQSEDDYDTFLKWKEWISSGIESVKPRSQRAPKKKHRAVTDARVGRW